MCLGRESLKPKGKGRTEITSLQLENTSQQPRLLPNRKRSEVIKYDKIDDLFLFFFICNRPVCNIGVFDGGTLTRHFL